MEGLSFESWLAQSDAYRAHFLEELVKETTGPSLLTQPDNSSRALAFSPGSPPLPLSPGDAGGAAADSGYSSGLSSLNNTASPRCGSEGTPVNNSGTASTPDASFDIVWKIEGTDDKTSEIKIKTEEVTADNTEDDSESSASPTAVKEEKKSVHQKPEESFIEIIARAIMGAPGQKMILAELYEHVATKYPYYPASSCAWRNSVRHNLSVNECFMKAGRAKNGRGFYWSIHPSCVQDFLKGDFNRRQARKRVQAANKRAEEEARKEREAAAVPAISSSRMSYPVQPAGPQTVYNQMTSTPIRQSYHPYRRPTHRQQAPATQKLDTPYYPQYTPGYTASPGYSPSGYTASTAGYHTSIQGYSTGTPGYSQAGYTPGYWGQEQYTGHYHLYSPLRNLSQLGYTDSVGNNPSPGVHYTTNQGTW